MRSIYFYFLGSFESAKADVEKAVILEPENSEFALGLQEIINIIGSSNSLFHTANISNKNN